MQFFKFIITFSLVLLMAIGASAQKYGVTEREIKIVVERDSFIIPEMVLKFSPTSLYPVVNPALQFAFEHYLNPTHSLQYELGGLLPYDFASRFEGRLRGGGFRIRTEYRKYMNERRRKGNLFIGGQYLFQEEIRPMSDWVWRSDGGYQQYMNYRKNVMSHGLLFVFGGNRTGQDGSRFHFEWAGALGLRSRTVFNNGLPDDVTIDNNDFLPYFEAMVNTDRREPNGTYILPTAQLTLRFGGVLK